MGCSYHVYNLSTLVDMNGAILSDEKLVQQYQITKDRACLRAIFERYYEELKGPFFKKWSGLSAGNRSDLYGEVWTEFLSKDMLNRWNSQGYSLKNWIYKNILEWLPPKTHFYRQLTEARLKFVREERALERKVRDEAMQSKIEAYKELEDEAIQFVTTILQDPNQKVLTEKQKAVLELLWMNYSRKTGARDEKELAADLGLTKDVFSRRKDRAVTALIRHAISMQKPHIILFFHLFFAYDFEKLKAIWDEYKGERDNQ